MEKYIPSTYTQAENDVKLEQYCNAVSYRLNNLENPSDVDCKRWPWELVQNAKDTIVNSETIKSVDVEFDHYEKSEMEVVKFSHNGEPFTAKAVSGLIWKFSAEKRDEFYTEDGVARDKQSTGRFGTGFLTTHTLSKRVKISGVMFDPSKKRNISVDFTLYREGGNDEELKKGVERTTKELKFDARSLTGNEKTEFSYILRNDINKKAAKLGIEEIKANGVLTMLFCPTVNSIHLNDKGQITQIKRLSNNPISSFQGMSRVVFEITQSDAVKPEYRHFIVVSKEAHSDVLTEYWDKERNLRLQVAVEVTEDNQLINQDYLTTPSVFCSLPLTGFENFTLPYYVNSNDFEPTGERMSIYLRKSRDGNVYDEKTGKDKHKYYNSGINWYILEESIKLFEVIVDYASENKFRNLYSFANGLNIDLNNAAWGEIVDMDALASRLMIPLRNLILNKKLVEEENGKGLRLPRSLRFPVQKKEKEETNKIFYGLCSEYYGEIVPLQEISNEWEKRKWKKFSKWNDDFKEKVENESFPVIQIIDLIKDVETNGTISSLPSTIESKFDWLNRLYTLLSEDNNAKNHAIIPNRNGVFKKFDDESLFDGRRISSSIFDFMKLYGIDRDDDLVNDKVEGISFGKIVTLEKVSDEINTQSIALIDGASKPQDTDLFAHLFLLFKRTPSDKILSADKEKHQKLLGFIETAFRTKCSELSNCGNEILDVRFKAWEKVNEWFAQFLVSEIANKGYIDIAANNTEETEKNCQYCSIEWLSDVVSFMLTNQYITISDLSKDGQFIIPNREGNFCAYKKLKVIGEIPEALLSVELENIGVKLNEYLIHPDFYFRDENNYPSKESLSSVVSSINDFFNKETDGSATSLEAAQYILFLDNSVLSNTNINSLRKLYIEFHGLSNITLKNISTTDLSLWDGAIRYIEKYLISTIERSKNVKDLTLVFRAKKESRNMESQNEDDNITTEEEDFAFDWLNRFISYLNSKHISYDNKKIIPNYHGEFVPYNAQTLYRNNCLKKFPQNEILIKILESELVKCTSWDKCLEYDDKLISNIVHPKLNGFTTQNRLFPKLSSYVDYLVYQNYSDKREFKLLKPLAKILLGYFDDDGDFIKKGNYFSNTYKYRNDIAMDLIYEPDTRKRLQQLYEKFEPEELDKLIEQKEIVTKIINNNISFVEIEKIYSFSGFDSLKLIISEFPDFDFKDLLERLRRTQGDFDIRRIRDEVEDKRKKEIGDKGEAFVYQQLLLQFTESQIIWSNLCKEYEQSDRYTQMNGKTYKLKTTSHNYDFKVETEIKTIYIEVKSTVGRLEQSKDFPLFFETKEWLHIGINNVNSNAVYLIARVFDVENSPSVYYLRQTTLV